MLVLSVTVIWGRPAFCLGKVLSFRVGGKKELALLLDLAKPAELGIGLESSVHYSTVSSLTDRSLYSAVKTKVLECRVGPRMLQPR